MQILTVLRELYLEFLRSTDANIITVDTSCNLEVHVIILTSNHHRLLIHSAKGAETPIFLLYMTTLLDLETSVKVNHFYNHHTEAMSHGQKHNKIQVFSPKVLILTSRSSQKEWRQLVLYSFATCSTTLKVWKNLLKSFTNHIFAISCMYTLIVHGTYQVCILLSLTYG